VTRIIWSLSAQDDIFDIGDHYDTIDPSLADDIVERLERSILPLVDFPRLGSAVADRPNMRKWTVTGTPFLTLYRVAPRAIEVRRVLHATSDWKR
jgi:toxin ParE1/3/4